MESNAEMPQWAKDLVERSNNTIAELESERNKVIEAESLKLAKEAELSEGETRKQEAKEDMSRAVERLAEMRKNGQTNMHPGRDVSEDPHVARTRMNKLSGTGGKEI